MKVKAHHVNPIISKALVAKGTRNASLPQSMCHGRLTLTKSLLDKGLAHDSPVTALEYLVRFESSRSLAVASSRWPGYKALICRRSRNQDAPRRKNPLAYHGLDIIT
jgi:hypothetical protein